MASSTNTAPSTAGKQPRGLRNNNPLNIRISGSRWIGQRDFPTDKAFCEFRSLEWGFRAAYITLRTYYVKHKCRTLRQVIARWAPPLENDTVSYATRVARLVHLPSIDAELPDPCDQKHWATWQGIILAMAEVENGVNCLKYLPQLKKGMRMAYGLRT